MNKRVLIIGMTVVSLPILVFIIILDHDQELYERQMYRDPWNLRSYDPELYEPEIVREPGDLPGYGPDSYTNLYIGYFRINPETILSALDQGEEHIFTPILGEDASFSDQPTNLSISWTQADFLKIASALGELVWDDPMDLNDWSIYYIYFSGSCQDTPDGFNDVSIAYYRTIEVNGDEVYATRLIKIYPTRSMVKCGSGATYSWPILHRWNSDWHRRWDSFDMAGDKVTADEALRIAEENGGKDVRSQVNNKCSIDISPLIESNEWYVHYYFVEPRFTVFVDLDTGEYEILGSETGEYEDLGSDQ